MNEKPFEMDPATRKRLLGLRDFEPVTLEQKKELLGSEERLSAFEAMDTSTMPRRPKLEMKKGIVLEMIREHLLDSSLLRGHPVVYLGSGTDVEYPLALGGRNIILVDPILEIPEAIQEVRTRIEKVIGQPLAEGTKNISFEFDFGQGKESVHVHLAADTYAPRKEKSYEIPEGTACVVLFASQGPGGVVRPDELMRSRLVPGGIILDDADVITAEGEERRLGK